MLSEQSMMKGQSWGEGNIGWLAAILFFAGCASAGLVMSSDEFESLVERNPDSHLTQFMAESGIVRSVEKSENGSMTFYVKSRTVNFVVDYAHELADVGKNGSISFLGRVRGGADGSDQEGRPMRAIRIQAIEIDTASARHYLTAESEYALSWHRNQLHLK